MAFAPDEGHMAEKPWKIKPGPSVKFTKFTISRDSLQPAPAAGSAGLRPPPRPPRPHRRRDGRLGRIDVRVPSGRPGSFQVSASQELKNLRTPGCCLARLAWQESLTMVEHIHALEHITNVLGRQYQLGMINDPLGAMECDEKRRGGAADASAAGL